MFEAQNSLKISILDVRTVMAVKTGQLLCAQEFFRVQIKETVNHFTFGLSLQSGFKNGSDVPRIFALIHPWVLHD